MKEVERIIDHLQVLIVMTQRDPDAEMIHYFLCLARLEAVEQYKRQNLQDEATSPDPTP